MLWKILLRTFSSRLKMFIHEHPFHDLLLVIDYIIFNHSEIQVVDKKRICNRRGSEELHNRVHQVNYNWKSNENQFPGAIYKSRRDLLE